ncbi:hypothetical protein N836_17330 [Leptolyngbya sp. Heron Island J]|nr:hypothetical protein N836_17330 [Leptolyngbya sp. Heron Island J]
MVDFVQVDFEGISFSAMAAFTALDSDRVNFVVMAFSSDPVAYEIIISPTSDFGMMASDVIISAMIDSETTDFIASEFINPLAIERL